MRVKSTVADHKVVGEGNATMEYVLSWLAS